MSDIAEAVGKRIYAIRTSKHMSRKDLAKRSGLHLTYIGQLERGERNATIATLESVSYALNVPIERFVEYITPGMASQETAEYSRAAEPPVQCGVSHLSRRTEPHCL